MFVRFLTLCKHVINKYVIKPNTTVVLKECNLKKKERSKKNRHSPAINTVPNFMYSAAETMRRKSSKVGYSWTTDPTATCAKAVCSLISQCQHGVVFQRKPFGCDCLSQMRKVRISNFQTIETIENFAKFRLTGN